MKYDGKSSTLFDRLKNFRSRIREMNTVTNTASARISGGETIIDEDGSLIFSDGGTLVLGSSSVLDSSGRELIDAEGNLIADSVVVYGDVLSASDYQKQREIFQEVLINTRDVQDFEETVDIEFPDWSSYASVTISLHLLTRLAEPRANGVMLYLNGLPISRPKSDSAGDVQASVFVTRKVTPESPDITLKMSFTKDRAPAVNQFVVAEISGVYTI